MLTLGKAFQHGGSTIPLVPFILRPLDTLFGTAVAQVLCQGEAMQKYFCCGKGSWVVSLDPPPSWTQGLASCSSYTTTLSIPELVSLATSDANAHNTLLPFPQIIINCRIL